MKQRLVPTFPARHCTPRCVQCGARADTYEERNLSTCPHCDCDLMLRPPRSYAELEGLHELESVHEVAPMSDGAAQARFDAAATNWVLVLCGIAICCVGLVAAAIMWA